MSRHRGNAGKKKSKTTKGDLTLRDLTAVYEALRAAGMEATAQATDNTQKEI